jgi:hypothetical protein
MWTVAVAVALDTHGATGRGAIILIRYITILCTPRTARSSIPYSRTGPIAETVLARATGTITIAGAGLAGARTSSGVTVPATAIGFRVTVLTVRRTGFCKDIAKPTQSEDATKGGGGDGFERLAT